MTLLYGVAVLVLLSIAGSALIKAARLSRAKRQDDLAFSTSIDRGQRYVVRKKLPGGYLHYGWTDNLDYAKELASYDSYVEIFDRTIGATESVGGLRVIK